jgi:hypothetical protein
MSRVWGVVMQFVGEGEMDMFYMKTPLQVQLGLKFDRVSSGLLSLVVFI